MGNTDTRTHQPWTFLHADDHDLPAPNYSQMAAPISQTQNRRASMESIASTNNDDQFLQNTFDTLAQSQTINDSDPFTETPNLNDLFENTDTICTNNINLMPTAMDVDNNDDMDDDEMSLTGTYDYNHNDHNNNNDNDNDTHNHNISLEDLFVDDDETNKKANNQQMNLIKNA